MGNNGKFQRHKMKNVKSILLKFFVAQTFFAKTQAFGSKNTWPVSNYKISLQENFSITKKSSCGEKNEQKNLQDYYRDRFLNENLTGNKKLSRRISLSFFLEFRHWKNLLSPLEVLKQKTVYQ